MQAAVSVEPEDSDLGRIVRGVAEEVANFGVPALHEGAERPQASGSVYVFAPGFTVCWRQSGQVVVDVTVIQPTMMDGNLMYQVECPGDQRAKRWVDASLLEPSAVAGSWSRALWNCATEEFEEG